MSEETESLQAPNWLSELERKRENRLKARLGHEAGAGAPCIKCDEKCPGLDLHFWRKICKNCKCSKEDHDVHDDDIYGWAQFQLLGSKPNRIKKKIVLPGKKDEVELDWAPKGNTETIDQYLKTLAPELLPVKGSQAAQDRKQLLQKQLPIHDLDPTLCHDLTDSELAQMQDYIKHMKSSAGVGQVIQFNVNYGNLHVMGEANALFLANRYAKGISSTETVKLMGENKAENLHKQLGRLAVQDQKELDAFFDKIPNPQNMTAHSEKLGYVNAAEKQGHVNLTDKLGYVNQSPTALTSKNLGYGAPKEINQNSSVSQFARENMLAETNPATEINRNVINLPHYAPGKLNIHSEQQNPQSIASNIRDMMFPNHDVANSNLTKLNPHQLTISENQQSPDRVNIGVIRDITYEPDVKTAVQARNELFEPEAIPPSVDAPQLMHCRKCGKPFDDGEFAVTVEKSNALYHSQCFNCAGCNQSLADMIYFYDPESDNIYCGRDFAKIRGIPRCQACDELIFVKEYCLAENSTYHLKHFCCFECDEALAGKDYVMEESQPVCLPCFEKLKANKCLSCGRVIRPDEQGLALADGIHFHAADECFCCAVCRKSLHGGKLLFRNNKLYCSHDCFRGGK